MSQPEDDRGGRTKVEVASTRIKLDISGDCYETYATAEQNGLELSDIQALLEANGIVYGVDSNAALAAIKNVGVRTLVARGSRHSDGNDGYYKPLEARPRSEGEKKLEITNVYTEDTIGEIYKPSSGIVGVDVFGRKVQPDEGKACNIFTGPEIKRVETETKIILEAAADGYLNAGPASVEIVPQHMVHGDIDYSDGELECAGSLHVTGDIKGSGNLRIRHDLHVEGSVEDAKIVAGGNVTVEGSFVGRGDGLIRAAGNVAVNVVLNQMIEAEGSITIGKECVNAHLIASEKIIATNATIMGGTVAAGEAIEAQTIGGEHYSTTRVKVGIAELQRENAIAIDREIQLQSKVIDQLKNDVYILVRERIDGNNFTYEKVEQLKLLQEKLRRQNDLVKELSAKKQESVLAMSRKKCPKLTVLGIIHQSVVAEINGVRVPLKRSYSNTTFEELRNEIIRTRNL